MSEQRFTVVGGGLAGLMTVIKLCEAGHKVDLLSIVPVKRSHSVCAQGGINGAVNTKGEGDHPDIHVKDTLRGGDFLAEQISVKGMCYAAPGIIYLLDRMGLRRPISPSTGPAMDSNATGPYFWRMARSTPLPLASSTRSLRTR